MKKVFVVILVGLFMVCATTTSSYAGIWYTGTIDKILVQQNGTVAITLDDSGTPRWGRLTGTEWKAILAVALTAEANDSTVRMNYQGGYWIMIEIQD